MSLEAAIEFIQKRKAKRSEDADMLTSLWNDISEMIKVRLTESEKSNEEIIYYSSFYTNPKLSAFRKDGLKNVLERLGDQPWDVNTTLEYISINAELISKAEKLVEDATEREEKIHEEFVESLDVRITELGIFISKLKPINTKDYFFLIYLQNKMSELTLDKYDLLVDILNKIAEYRNI